MFEVYKGLIISSILVFSLYSGYRQIPTISTSGVGISSPIPGQVLQGSVPIILNTVPSEIVYIEVSFAYLNDPTDTWFLLFQSDQPVLNQKIAIWDTSIISDGNYSLRLVVEFANGVRESVLVSGLRLRNYSPIETDTPQIQESLPSLTMQVETTPTITEPAEPFASEDDRTDRSLNAISLEFDDVENGFIFGVIVSFAIFGMFGLYKLLRSFIKAV